MRQSWSYFFFAMFQEMGCFRWETVELCRVACCLFDIPDPVRLVPIGEGVPTMWGGESHYGKMNLQFQYYLFLSIFQMKINGENELQLVPTMWGIVALNGKMNLQFQYYSGYPL